MSTDLRKHTELIDICSIQLTSPEFPTLLLELNAQMDLSNSVPPALPIWLGQWQTRLYSSFSRQGYWGAERGRCWVRMHSQDWTQSQDSTPTITDCGVWASICSVKLPQPKKDLVIAVVQRVQSPSTHADISDGGPSFSLIIGKKVRHRGHREAQRHLLWGDLWYLQNPQILQELPLCAHTGRTSHQPQTLLYLKTFFTQIGHIWGKSEEIKWNHCAQAAKLLKSGRWRQRKWFYSWFS